MSNSVISDKVEISRPAYARLEKILTIADETLQPWRKDGVSEAVAWQLVAHLIALNVHIRADREKQRLSYLEASLVIGEPLGKQQDSTP